MSATARCSPNLGLVVQITWTTSLLMAAGAAGASGATDKVPAGDARATAVALRASQPHARARSLRQRPARPRHLPGDLLRYLFTSKVSEMLSVLLYQIHNHTMTLQALILHATCEGTEETRIHVYLEHQGDLSK